MEKEKGQWRQELAAKFGFVKPVNYSYIKGSRHIMEERESITIYIDGDCKDDPHVNIEALAKARLGEKRGTFVPEVDHADKTAANWLATYRNAATPLDNAFVMKEIREHLPFYFHGHLVPLAQASMTAPYPILGHWLSKVLTTEPDHRNNLIMPLYVLKSAGIAPQYDLRRLLADSGTLAEWEQYIAATLKAADYGPTICSYNGFLKDIDAPFRLRKTEGRRKKWGFHPCTLTAAPDIAGTPRRPAQAPDPQRAYRLLAQRIYAHEKRTILNTAAEIPMQVTGSSMQLIRDALDDVKARGAFDPETLSRHLEQTVISDFASKTKKADCFSCSSATRCQLTRHEQRTTPHDWTSGRTSSQCPHYERENLTSNLGARMLHEILATLARKYDINKDTIYSNI